MGMIFGDIVKLRSQEKLCSLHEFWATRKGDRPFPERGDIMAEDLKPWLGSLVLLDVLDRGRDFRFRVYGTDLVETFGWDLTGRTVHECCTLIGSKSLEEYQEVVRTGGPVFYSRISPSSKKHIQMAKLSLPLGNRTVTHVLSGIYLADSAIRGY